MKILLASPQHKTARGVIVGYCKKALEALGNEVLVFDFEEHPYSQGKFISYLKSVIRPLFPSLPSPYDISAVRSLTDKKINRMLLDLVYEQKPQLLLVLLGENIFPGTINKISKELGVVCVNWVFDTLLLPQRKIFFQGVAPFYDYIFLVDSLEVLRCIDHRAKHVETLPLGCDPDLHRRVELSRQDLERYGSDVAFVGTVTAQRQKVLEALSGFNLKIWGGWQGKSGLLKRSYQKQNIYGEEMVKVYNASKIIVDIHGLFGVENEIFNVTPRMFEVPACGGFLLTNDVPQIYDFYKVGQELIAYKDIDDLKYLIRHYLEHPQHRCEIAERAYQRAHQGHTYFQRLEKLLQVIKNSSCP